MPGHGIIPSDLDIQENTDKVFQNAIKHLYTDHCLYNRSTYKNNVITIGYI